MDGNDFSRVTRLGRAAADALIHTATTGAPFDGFATDHLIARFVGSSGGIPSLLHRPDAKRLPLVGAFRIDENSNLRPRDPHPAKEGPLDLFPAAR
ncbi:MAG TPA: hypothetical protein VFT22_12185 [Kofleriaceae bacterium]|nr:hypothetical protein [Kofleriaceae bacterium]